MKLRNFMEASTEGIMIFDAGLNVVDCNDACAHILGMKAADLIGKNSEQISPDVKASGRWDQYMRLIETGEPIEFDDLITHPVLGAKHLHLRAFKVGEGIGTIITDVTDRKEIDTRIQQSQKMESIGRLAGGVAHDFNNQLTAIRGFAELVLESIDEDDLNRDAVMQIQLAAISASELTQQLLAFSRKQIIAPRPVDLNEAITRSGKMIRRLIGENVRLFLSLPEGVGHVMIDPTQVDQILMNLAINSRDAITDVGNLTFQTHRQSVGRIECMGCSEGFHGDFVVLSVTDTGCGMSEDDLDKIFEPFYTTKEMGKGTGLGLATVHGIVHQNLGHLTVASTPGAGTMFRIYLPVVEP